MCCSTMPCVHWSFRTILAANVEALQTYEAVDTAITSADTVIEVADEAGTIADVLPRPSAAAGADATAVPPRLSCSAACTGSAGTSPTWPAA